MYGRSAGTRVVNRSRSTAVLTLIDSCSVNGSYAVSIHSPASRRNVLPPMERSPAPRVTAGGAGGGASAGAGAGGGGAGGGSGGAGGGPAGGRAGGGGGGWAPGSKTTH